MTEQQAPTVPSHTVRRTMLLCWLLFTALYWVGAWHKPYAAHDFYSWVYAERCTAAEILTFEDTGIGHPPLFHLSQKAVQSALPFYHPLNIRLANYLYGSLFVISLAALFGRRPGFGLFCCGLAMSAITLDTFMLGRMWGLVLLMALLFITTGERLCRRFSIGRCALFIGLMALGLFSDFSFLLLLPYALMVLFLRGHRGVLPAHLMLAGATILMVLLRCRHAGKTGAMVDCIPLLLYDLFNAFTMGAWMLFTYWHEELYLLAVVIFVVGLAMKQRAALPAVKPPVTAWAATAALLAVLVGGTLVRLDLIRVRYAFLLLLVFLLLSARGRVRYPFFDPRQVGDRSVVGIACGLMALVAVNPYYWTSLIQARFLLSLFPLLLLWLADRLDQRTRNILAILMIGSGLFYTASNGVLTYYPPPVVPGNEPLVYTDVYAYSNQYLRQDIRGGEEPPPYILEDKHFVTSCRVCRMGTADVPWQTFQSFRMVGPAEVDHRTLVPETFQLVREETHLSPLDRLLFRFLTPIHTRCYSVSEFQRFDAASEAH